MTTPLPLPRLSMNDATDAVASARMTGLDRLHHRHDPEGRAALRRLFHEMELAMRQCDQRRADAARKSIVELGGSGEAP